ncbi:MAG: PDZ domain-containing protein, partial [Candidatus Schekmanbacteria bacterium]
MRKYQFFFIAFVLLLMPFVSESALDQRHDAVVRAVEKTSPAVVNISTEIIVKRRFNPFFGFRDDSFFDDFFRDFFDMYGDNTYRKNALGSGVIINPKGVILTNYHVIERASKIFVTLIDGRKYEAELIGADPKSDIAVIKIIDSKKSFPYVKMGDSSDLLIGETVIAIGNPFGLSNTVTTGVVSAVGRSINTRDKGVFTDLIQTDASINPGNSGGALLNINGELIGINTAIFQNAQGIGFAIPINRAKRIVNDLLNYGKVRRSWIGIFVKDLDRKFRKLTKFPYDNGIIVGKVLNNSPASRAGIKPGDIIFRIDNAPVSNTAQYHQLMSTYTPGSRVKFTIFRDKEMTIIVKTSSIPLKLADKISDTILGIKVSSITYELAKRYNLYVGSGSGVVITNVRENSPAEKLGLEIGDVILQIEGKKLKDKKDYDSALFLIDTNGSVPILIIRGRTRYYASID